MTTQTLTITEFLLARIDEDEAVARAAIADQTGRWEVAHDPQGTYLEVLGQFVRDFRPPAPDDAPGDFNGGHWWQVAAWTNDYGDDLPDTLAAHIARHDPARVLAECEAKRRIVEEHPEPSAGLTVMDHWCWESGDPSPGCPTTRALASVYAYHPDYRQEWRA